MSFLNSPWTFGHLYLLQSQFSSAGAVRQLFQEQATAAQTMGYL